MKLVGFLLATCIYGIAGDAGIREEWNAKVAVAAGKCKDEFQISDDIFNGLVKDRVVPTNPNEKCFLTCMMDGLGFVRDGRIVIDLLNQGSLLETQEDIDKSRAINEMCVKKGEDVSDNCEAGYKVTTCLVDEFAKAGLHSH